MFRLGGQPALDPSEIIKGLTYNPWWKNKVNSFKLVRGAYPSTGFLLMTKAAINAMVLDKDADDPNAYILDISPFRSVYDVPLEYRVLIKSIVEVNPGASPSDTAACLVELTDSRKYLEDTILYENFNIVESHSASGLRFNEATANSATIGWKWPEIIRKIWDASGIHEELSEYQLGYTYPDARPCNIYSEGVSAAKILDSLLKELGITLSIGNDKKYSITFHRTGYETQINNTLIENNYLKYMREVKHAEYEPHEVPGGTLRFNFPSRKYLRSSSDSKVVVSPIDRYNEKALYHLEHDVDIPTSKYIDFNIAEEEDLFCSPVASFVSTSDDPINKSDLEDYVDRVHPFVTRMLASEFGPVITLGGFHHIIVGELFAAVTYWENCGASGRLAGAFTKIEVPQSATYSHRFNRPSTITSQNFPHHKSIVVKPKNDIDNNKVGFADVIDHTIISPSQEEATSAVYKQIKILNISGEKLEKDKSYTSDFHWQTQYWAVWPGSTGSEDTGGGTGTGGAGNPILRFRLLEDLELGQGYAEATLINENGDAVDADGNQIVDASSVVNWKAGEQIQPGDLRKATVVNPIDGSWQIGDVLESTDIQPRVTNNTFNSDEASHWKKYEFSDKIIVHDPEIDNTEGGKFFAYGPYHQALAGNEEGEDVAGFTGLCMKIPGDQGDDYAGTGKPGYFIIMLESVARWVKGKTIQGRTNQYIYVELVDYWGAYPNQRRPKTSILAPSESGGASRDVIRVTVAPDSVGFNKDIEIIAVYNDRSNEYEHVGLPDVDDIANCEYLLGYDKDGKQKRYPVHRC